MTQARVRALLHGWIGEQMLQGGKRVPWAKLGESRQGLSGVASLRFPQHPPLGGCPPPLEFPKLPETFQTSVWGGQAMTHSQVLFFSLAS